METYEKKYKELEGKIKKAYLYAQTDSTKAVLEDILPELKESKDEKIRKDIIRVFTGEIPYTSKEENEKYIAWLEKQGRCDVDCPQNHQDSNRPNGCIVLEDFNGGEGFYKVHLDYLNKKQVEEVEEMVRMWNKELKTSNENIINCIDNLLEKQGEKTQGKSALEAIQEEKVDNANKVEPKFKVGDWITDGYLHCKISDVLDDRYIVDTKFTKRSAIPFKRENEYHLWTIEDAKDGDILASIYNKPFIYNGNHNSTLVGAYCGISTENRFNVATEKCRWTANVNIRPATKDQRDTLLKAIADAGYEWNAEKKELKKSEPKFKVKYAGREYNVLEIKESAGVTFYGIEDEPNHIDYVLPEDCEIISGYCVKEKGNSYPTKSAIFSGQNSAWSEEDEMIALSIEQVMNCASLLNIVPEKIDKIRTWLKSPKERCTWKPSEEQMDALEHFVRSIGESGYASPYDANLKLVHSLLNDLKKLKGK